MDQLRRPPLEDLLRERILVLDGAMGTLMQAHGLGEDDYRRGPFAEHAQPLAGNHDLLCMTRPDVVAEAHRAYLEAGADVVETNSFSATRIGQADYGTEGCCYELNVAAARVAREEADAYTRADPSKPRYVAGALGPTNRTASMSAEVEDPGARAVRFEELVEAYREQARGLLDGGADLLLVETVFDTLNCKAALFAIDEELEARGARVPVVVSGTITDASGRTLSGQTVEAFWTSIAHFPLAAVGFNCALGPREMRPHLEALGALAEVPVSCYPNAGLPNEYGEYDLGAEEMAGLVADFARAGLLNLVGGCCGTTPEHVRAIAEAVKGMPPRIPPPPRGLPAFAGLERCEIRPDSLFVNVGERTNVTGSKRFARLIRDGDHEEALSVARQQVANGAQLIDVCMDEGMLESAVEMRRFLDLLVAEPEIYRVPVMVDSSKWEVIEEGLRALPGRSVVNSLSLKEGEEEFRKLARLARRYGAAVVVMAFDEQGQAVDVERRVAIVTRALGILRELGFRDEEVIFDLNVLAVGTGIAEHDDYARTYLEALRELKGRFPGCSFSGGISNLSFSFRGADKVREALHAVFLFHAVKAGLTMGIVNAGQLAVYDELPAELREICTDLVLNRRSDAGERLLAWAAAHADEGGEEAAAVEAAWRAADVDERLAHALLAGDADHLEEDLPEALERHGSALAVIEGPLMAGMDEVGDRFGSGRMFLPQVVKSARVMKKAVAWLEPHLQAGKGEAPKARGRVLLATVKGDVHDIGKNIVGVILGCNGYAVDDLGVMVPCERILEQARATGADLIGLSGLITPSLDEMVHVAAEMERTGLELPLLIGGATTSAAHTAVKIAPARAGLVTYVPDASRAVGVVGELLGNRRAAYVETTRQRQQELRERRAEQGAGKKPLLALSEARARAQRPAAAPAAAPSFTGARVLRDFPLEELLPRIDWTPFFSAWELAGRWPAILDDEVVGAQARELHAAAEKMLARIVDERLFQAHAAYGFWPAHADGDDLVLQTEAGPRRLPMLRQQRDAGPERANRSLADFVAEQPGVDHLGAFVVTTGHGVEELAQGFREDHDDYSAILAQALADRLAEAFAETLHERVRREDWGYAPAEALDNEALIREEYRGIRPAPGYPACPDHSLKDDIFALLDAEAATGVNLTESRAMTPTASVAGFYFAHPEAQYFGVGRLGADQVADYAQRRAVAREEAERRLRSQIS